MTRSALHHVRLTTSSAAVTIHCFGSIRCAALVIPVYLDVAMVVMGAVRSRVRKALGKTSREVKPHMIPRLGMK